MVPQIIDNDKIKLKINLDELDLNAVFERLSRERRLGIVEELIRKVRDNKTSLSNLTLIEEVKIKAILKSALSDQEL